MKQIHRIINQIKFEILAFARNPTATAFTLFFPLVFLGVGAAFHGNSLYQGRIYTHIELFLPMVIAYSIFTANYTNLAMRVSMLRDQGVLKRVRGTPAPTWLYMTGHIGASAVIAIFLTALLGTAGSIFFHVHFHLVTIPALLFYLVISSFVFCAMALCLTAIIPNGDSAPAIVQVPAFIQFVLSAGWMVSSHATVANLTRILPLTALSHAMFIVTAGHRSGLGFDWRDSISMVWWGLVLSLVATRKFKWENSPGKTRKRRRHSATTAQTSSV